MSCLTGEQGAVVAAAPDDKVLVTAGPGTGKTHTLVARLNALVEDHGMQPGDEILVLSFSRTAVLEIRTRLRAEDSGGSFVSARTFDSFATRLLAEHDPEGAWQKLSYEGRIEQAVRVVRDPDRPILLGHIRHIVVDEAQDVVGPRAELVMALLSTCAAGFTVFGDPAQGIYNFQLADPQARREGSARLYRWLRETFPELHELTLSVNFRARTDAARAALDIGSALNEADPDYRAIEFRLRTVLLSAQTLETLEKAAVVLRRTTTGTAILCRTNGEALVASRTLYELGIAHTLKRAATDTVVGRWVADALGSSKQRVVVRSQVMERLATVQLPGNLDPESAWRLLKRMDRPAHRRSQDLDLDQVATRIRSGDVPDELTAPQETDLIVVSTVHRAKGLEFDRVIVTEAREHDRAATAEEARTLYVALTRPRRELLHIKAIDTRQLTNAGMPGERWVQKGWKPWQRLGMETRGDDADSDAPPGVGTSSLSATHTQAYISDSVNRGDPLTLTLRPATGLTAGPPSWDIRHGEVVVGSTGPEFGLLMARLLNDSGSGSVRWPGAISGLRVDAVDTVAGSAAAGPAAGLGPAGLWLRVRPFGLGRFEFKESRT